MVSSLSPNPEQDRREWVEETSFGKWFLTTNVWYRYVLEETILNIRNLIDNRFEKGGRLLEIGCGEGRSFELLDSVFQPDTIVAVDIDKTMLQKAEVAARKCNANVEICQGSAKRLNLPDNSFDLIFCHQLIHHIQFQEDALLEFKRLLKPGGKLLLSESCRPFLNVWWVKYFFRHPKMKQKDAQGYKNLVRQAGYEFDDSDVLETTPWWSKRDLGFFARHNIQFWKSSVSEISIVATKPADEI